jgi:hypothetical protein
MITTHKRNLIARCKERGYALAEVMPCVVSQDNDQWTIDELHPAYPRAPKPGSRGTAVPQPAPSSGPGTELKALLKDWLGIVASPNCSCNARARQMDEWGPDLCEQNLPTIVDWLGEQAAARKLPFVRFAGEQAVKLAIRRARKKAAR